MQTASDTEILYAKPRSLRRARTHYCAGCGHGIVHRIICELVDEFDIRERTVAVAPVGCAVLAYNYFDFDTCEAPHGRTPAVATGLKRVLPGRFVFSYQGDGDLAAIGTAEIIHAANRGEKICVFFINNAVYGMTQGQMAPTSLVGQKTATSPRGRDPENEGYPIRVCELIATLQAPAYIERVAVSSPRNVRRAKKAIRKAFQTQLEGRGFSLVEILSPCPTYWRVDPITAVKELEARMPPIFPLGVYRDTQQNS
jgi:2-oxoglutarate ferredoxin oxidoreductase subunit beta